jgi:predicted metalloprotease
MRWKRGERSENLEDRRAQSPGRRPFPFPMSMPGGGRVRLPAGRTPRISLGGLLLLLLVFWLLSRQGVDLSGAGLGTDVGAGVGGAAPGSVAAAPGEEELVDFVSFVLDDVQSTWQKLLPGYRDAKLVLFREAVESGCGFAQSQVGPFYCPADQKVYVDLGFYEELRRRFGAPGDFAQAYVLAHEIGHHVQRLSGIQAEVRRSQQESPRRANALSVKMELQADCLAGVWGHAAAGRGLLETGDVEEGLGAAAAIGDDRIQRMGGGHVQPEAWTHGSSEQRVEWFRRGLESGDPDRCDSFAAGS